MTSGHREDGRHVAAQLYHQQQIHHGYQQDNRSRTAAQTQQNRSVGISPGRALPLPPPPSSGGWGGDNTVAQSLMQTKQHFNPLAQGRNGNSDYDSNTNHSGNFQQQQNQQQQGKHGERVDGGKRNIAGADGGTDEAMLAMTASPTFEHLAKLDIFRSTIVLYLDRGSATVAGCASRRCLAGVAAYILKVIAAEGVAEDEKLDTLRRNRINSPSKVRTRCKPTLFPYHGILPYCLPLVCVHRLWRIVGRRSLLSWE